MEFSQETPIALVLPFTFGEVGTPALRGIVRELKHVPYLSQIVVGIDGAVGLRQWRKAQHFFEQLPQKPVMLWNDGPPDAGPVPQAR